MNKTRSLLVKIAEIFAFGVLFFLLMRRTLLLWSMSLEGFGFGQIMPELLLWGFILIFFIIQIMKEIGFSAYIVAWKQNFPLLVFIVVAILSITWTINRSVTGYKLLLLLITSLVAAYVGLTRIPRDLANMLALLGGAAAVLSFMLAISFPVIGTMPGYPYEGAWRGIFWTRARLGSFMALINMIFLYLGSRSKHRPWLLVYGAFYLLTLGLIFLSESATSIILVLILHILFAVLALWLKLGPRFKRQHYVILGFTFLLFAIAVATNLDYLFGLLGRNTTLTGRIPLWNYLIQEIVAQRPALGYGFGAIWDTNFFRQQMQGVMGWKNPVIVADNGFLDILLHLGWVGLIPFLVTIGLAGVRAFRYFYRMKTLDSSLPVLIWTYVIVTNFSLSYFLELEAFVWFLLVVILFMTSKKAV